MINYRWQIILAAKTLKAIFALLYQPLSLTTVDNNLE